MRTFSRADMDEARAAWDAGDFSTEWRAIRHRAAMGGIIFPPSGTKWDSWEDDAPSQRAMLIRAIRETPTLLDKCIVEAKSWHDVIERLKRGRDDWRETQHVTERDDDWRRDDPDHRTSVQTLAAILERIEGAR